MSVPQQQEPSLSPPTNLPEADEKLIKALSAVYTHLVALHKGQGPDELTRFHAVRAPNIGIHDYLTRLRRYFFCSPECFLVSLVYLDRILKSHGNFKVTDLNVHRLLITSVSVSAKFYDDIYYSNAYYAKVGGVTCKELNILEKELLRLLDWKLCITPQEYEQYLMNVMQAAREAEKGEKKEEEEKEEKEEEMEPVEEVKEEVIDSSSEKNLKFDNPRPVSEDGTAEEVAMEEGSENSGRSSGSRRRRRNYQNSERRGGWRREGGSYHPYTSYPSSYYPSKRSTRQRGGGGKGGYASYYPSYFYGQSHDGQAVHTNYIA